LGSGPTALKATSDAPRILGPGGDRVHAIEFGWLGRLQATRLFAYRFPAALFRPFETHAMVAERPVEPLGPAEPVGDLLELHEGAGIQLRVLPNLWAFVDAVAGQHLGFQRDPITQCDGPTVRRRAVSPI
jgi:hypothetical protein